MDNKQFPERDEEEIIPEELTFFPADEESEDAGDVPASEDVIGEETASQPEEIPAEAEEPVAEETPVAEDVPAFEDDSAQDDIPIFGDVPPIADAPALRAYVCNVMTQEGETEGYTVSDHIAAIFAHSAQGLFRLCLTNSSPIPKAVAARYAEEGAERIRCDKSACAALGVEVVERPVATVESGFVRHSSAALARELILLHAERSVRIAGARFRPREDAYQMEEQK